MKTAFIHARSKLEVKLPQEVVDLLPKKIGIATTIQHLSKIKTVLEQLPEAKLAGQVLGCRSVKDIDADAYLYIGTGVFHPLKIALETEKKVYCYNPESRELKEITEKQRREYKDKIMKSLNIFLNSQNIGVMITTKVGQNFNKIETYSVEKKLLPLKKLKEKFPDKNFYAIVFDEINETRMEDFNFINCWVNTACSRIADRKLKIVNYDEVMELEGSEQLVLRG